ncbi:MAG: DUF1080 domain-containing protein [Bacteroidia bacterium]|nr:MAG: DUF1080 domain-containing protein [Bacteroidia bacterium]
MKRFINLLIFAGLVLNIQAQKPEETEDWSRKPDVVTPGKGTLPPSDAIVLYGGAADLEKWESEINGPAKWAAGDELTVTPRTGGIKTKQSFGDMQLHIEWRAPAEVKGDGQGRGNSGIFLMGKYEVQVLDSYNSETYYNGQAGSIYKQTIPLVNACLPPGEWQAYDVLFRAPVFKEDGTKACSAYVTVIHNGVLIQNHVEILGTTEYIGKPKNDPHPAKLPISLQDHGNPVSYRNIWVREL